MCGGVDWLLVLYFEVLCECVVCVDGFGVIDFCEDVGYVFGGWWFVFLVVDCYYEVECVGCVWWLLFELFM